MVKRIFVIEEGDFLDLIKICIYNLYLLHRSIPNNYVTVIQLIYKILSFCYQKIKKNTV